MPVAVGESLVAQRRRDALATQEGGKQVGLRIAETDSLFEDIGRAQRHPGILRVVRMRNLVPDPFVGPACDVDVVDGLRCEYAAECSHTRVIDFDELVSEEIRRRIERRHGGCSHPDTLCAAATSS
nr:hypothetical protein [Rhodococcus spelaei]